MTSIVVLKATSRFLVEAAIVAGAVAFAGLPALALAATYAYFNQAGEVSIVTANDPTTAIATAPNIDEHSGVMLITNPSDGVVGDKVPVN